MGKLATTVLLSPADGDGRADRVMLSGSPGTQGGVEASGIYIGTVSGAPFVNVQHANNANDMTLAVTGQ